MAGPTHSIEVIKPQLEIDESLPLQERSWVVQRIGWWLLFAFVAVAALGLFGEGFFSKKTVSAPPASVEYEQFFRHEATMEMVIDVNQSTGNQTIVAFPNSYLKNFRIESILPEPKENKIQGDQVHYVFEGNAPMHLVFYLVPQQVGQLEGKVMVNNNTFNLSQFIYP